MTEYYLPSQRYLHQYIKYVNESMSRRQTFAAVEDAKICVSFDGMKER